jgi:hypothetical protein
MKTAKNIKQKQLFWWDRMGWRASIICLTTWLVAVTIDHSHLRDLMVEPISMRIGHSLRQWTGFAAPLDSRLKILVMDDSSVEMLQRENLLATDWQKLIGLLGETNVRSILIADHFSLQNNSGSRGDALSWEKYQTPIFAQALISTARVPGRALLDLESPAYSIMDLLEKSDEEQRRFLSDINWMPVEDAIFHGPRSEMINAFAGVGHVVSPDNGYFKPFVRVSKMRTIRHFALNAADSLRLQGREIIVNDIAVPFSGSRIPINFPLLTELNFRIQSIGKVLAEGSTELADYGPGDTVLILPRMYAGSIAKVDTPIGYWPSGYVQAAIVNSVISNNWIAPVGIQMIWHLLAALLGCLVGWTLTGKSYWIASSAGVLINAGLGICLFVVFSDQTPWLVSSFCFWLSSGLVCAERWRRSKVSQLRIERELETAQFVQESFVPERSAELRYMKIVGEYMQARECSGDWWGRFSLDDDRELVVIGDALGHGVPAALVTCMAYSCFKSLVLEAKRLPSVDISPADMLEDFNQVLHTAIGGVVASILLQVAARAFGIYVANFNSYQTLYGALAALPLFLMLLYICWLIILLGAVVSWRVQLGFPKAQDEDTLDAAKLPKEKLRNVQVRAAMPAITLIAIHRKFSEAKGQGLSAEDLADELKLPVSWLGDSLDALESMGYIVCAQRPASVTQGVDAETEAYFPAFPASSIQLEKLFADLDSPITEWLENWKHDCEFDLSSVVQRWSGPDRNKAMKENLQTTIDQLQKKTAPI